VRITQFFLLSIFLTLFAQAQAPMSVPNQITVAGVKLKLNAEARREVAETLDLLTRSQYHFQLKVDRTNLYMHFVEEVLKKEGIPEDFKFLAIQEGEFVSDAVSSSNAVGFWQFKKATAQELGVRVDQAVDERKHIIASTIGATKYLKRSNFVFDNWVLSMQSYLQGLTGTQRSAADKWYGAKSMNITGKSHWYVKKFIAHKLAFEGFVGEGRKNPEVSLSDYEGRGKSLKQVSNELGVSFEELKRFNKWLNQSRIPGDKSYKVIYPIKASNKRLAKKKEEVPKQKKIKEESSKEKNKEKAEPINEPEKVDAKSDQVRNYYGIKPVEGNTGIYPEITGHLKSAEQAGQIKMNGIPAIRATAEETTESLALRTGLSISRLKKYNDIGERGEIRAGLYYYLKKKKAKAQVHYHIVQSGETLWKISQDYGIQLNKLLRKNRMRAVEELKIGRVLWLRFIRPADIPIEYENVLTIRDSISAEDRLISELSPAVSRKKTNERLRREMKPQTVISVPDRVINKTPPELKAKKNQKVIIHTVEPKETFFAISSLYEVEIDEILEWNALEISDGLQIGQKLQLLVEKKETHQRESIIHVVKKGETLWAISQKYGVSVEKIKNWNGKSDISLALGEKLKIFIGN
jgi:membrane-bound lytic murein transglycosylase D